MTTRSHVHEIRLDATPESVFDLLIRPSAIRSWWQAARAIVIPEAGGTWAAAWGGDEDAPDYVTSAVIEVFDPPRRLALGRYAYRAKGGRLPFEADFRIEFTVEPSGAGSLLRVRQDGFPLDPIADDHYRGCETGWKATFEGIVRFLREGR